MSSALIIDGSIMGIVLVSGLLSFLRGLTREVVAVVSWVLATLAALWGFAWAGKILFEVIGPLWLANALGGVLCFIVVIVGVTVVTRGWWTRLQAHRARPVDRALGLLFGMGRGLALMGLAYLFFIQLVPADRHPQGLAGARLLPLVETTSDLLWLLLPEQDRQRAGPLRQTLKTLKRTEKIRLPESLGGSEAMEELALPRPGR